MKLRNQEAEIVDKFESKRKIKSTAILKQIEYCGRVCYKSEHKTKKNSYLPFIKSIINRGHESVLEMGAISIKVKAKKRCVTNLCKRLPKYTFIDMISSRSSSRYATYIVTGNARSFRDLYKQNKSLSVVRNIIKFLQYKYPVLYSDLGYVNAKATYKGSNFKLLTIQDLCSLPSELYIKHRFILVHIITNRAVSHEIVRHRPCSYLQESQRYCRYTSGRFGNDVCFIVPEPFCLEEDKEFTIWKNAMVVAEVTYKKLLETESPQAARIVLPNSCKTEMVMFTNLQEWSHFLKLRCSSAADPSMQVLAKMIRAKLDNFVNIEYL